MDRRGCDEKPSDQALVKYGPTELITTKTSAFLARGEPTLAFGSAIPQEDPAEWAITGACLNFLSQLETEDVLNSIIPPREWEDGGKKWRQKVSTVPATNADVHSLLNALDTCMKERDAKESGICPIRRELYSQCLDEIIRQTTIICAERGILLYKIRNELQLTVRQYESLYISATAYAMRKSLVNELMRLELQCEIEQLYLEQVELEKQEKELQQELYKVNQDYSVQQRREADARNAVLDDLKKLNSQLKKQVEVSMGMGRKRAPKPVEE